MATTPTRKVTISDPVTLIGADVEGACPRCLGRRRYTVLAGNATVGYLTSDHAWHVGVPDDPAEHPPFPHYEVEWTAYTTDGRLFPLDIVSIFHAAAALRAAAADGDIPAVFP